MNRRAKTPALLLIVSAWLVGCGDAATLPSAASEVVKPVAQSGEMPMNSKAVYQQITSLVGEAKASDAGFCRKVPLGHRPCGGPESYLIYSAEGLDEPLLLKLVAQYQALRQAEHEASGMMSTCEMIPEPGVQWVGGYCKASPTPGDAI